MNKVVLVGSASSALKARLLTSLAVGQLIDTEINPAVELATGDFDGDSNYRKKSAKDVGRDRTYPRVPPRNLKK